MDVGVIIFRAISVYEQYMSMCIYDEKDDDGGGDVWEWHVSVIDDAIVPAFPRRPSRRHFI